MSETKFYDVDGDKYLTSLEEDDTSVVPRVGDVILWEVYTYKVKTLLHDVEDGLVVITVEMTGVVEEGGYGLGGPPYMIPEVGVKRVAPLIEAPKGGVRPVAIHPLYMVFDQKALKLPRLGVITVCINCTPGSPYFSFSGGLEDAT